MPTLYEGRSRRRRAFDFARTGSTADERSLEAEIMDWSDDVTYAVHDLEDFFRLGLIPLDRLASSNDSRRRRFSYLALNSVVDADGEERQVMRFNMPFGRVGAGEFGTYVIGLRPRAGGDAREHVRRHAAGNSDRILDFSTALTGNLFFAPTVRFLDDGQ